MADEAHISVEVAYHCAQQVREVFHQATPAQGRRLAARPAQRPPTCPIPEIACLGRTLRKWKDAFLAYFDTAGASNGPTETINGIIELGRRIARGYRNPTNYQLRMLLIAGGLDTSPHTQLSRASKGLRAFYIGAPNGYESEVREAIQEICILRESGLV